MLGNHTLALAAWLSYGLGVTVSQIVAVFNRHLQLPLTPGGLVQMWHRLANPRRNPARSARQAVLPVRRSRASRNDPSSWSCATSTRLPTTTGELEAPKS